MTAPPRRTLTCTPRTVNVGRSAFRKTWWLMTVGKRNPLALAVRTYSWPSSSSTPARTAARRPPRQSQPQGYCGEHQVPQGADRISGDGHVPDGWEEPPVQGEEQDEHHTKPERRNGNAGEGDPH